jgi:integrase
MVDVTAADLRRIVQKLDEQVATRLRYYEAQSASDEERNGRKPGLSAKSAQNIWSLCTAGFGEACSSKLDSLRVLEQDPTDGVQPPTSGDDREQAALYPSEVVQLLSCSKIPARRRITYFVAMYVGARRSELARMQAEDVDLEHGMIAIRGGARRSSRRFVRCSKRSSRARPAGASSVRWRGASRARARAARRGRSSMFRVLEAMADGARR